MKKLKIPENYAVLHEMKLELKQRVREIREGSRQASYQFRHLHVVRCLLKGRTLEQIEGPDLDHKKTGNRLDMKYLDRLLALWKPKHEAELVRMAERHSDRLRELVPAVLP